MALPPKFQAHRLLVTSPSVPSTTSDGVAHTLELYLDYNCPFSAKLFKTVYHTVLPALRSSTNPPLPSHLEIIFRHQIQPWHPTSTLTHEAALAVLKTRPQLFWDFSAALFEVQKDFFDVNVVHETRNATYHRLAALAREIARTSPTTTESKGGSGGSGDIGEEVYKQVVQLLTVPDKPAADGSLNVGNAVTNDLKLVIKMARLVGIHVSPTVVFNGVVANEISSSWTSEQWSEWLKKNVV